VRVERGGDGCYVLLQHPATGGCACPLVLLPVQVLVCACDMHRCCCLQAAGTCGCYVQCD
jgi:hypothetical protein